MSVCYVAGNVKCHGKSGNCCTYNKETHEVYFIEVFRVEEEVRYAEVFAKTARYHSEQNNPAKNKDMISLDIVE
jgi:hypothetical protein